MATRTTPPPRSKRGETRALRLVKQPPAYCDALIDLARSRKNLVIVSPDTAARCGIRTFADAHPHQFIQTGGSTHHTLSIALGLASQGKHAVVIMPAAHLAGSLQFLNEAREERARITIIGTHAGSNRERGLQDLALMRSAGIMCATPTPTQTADALVQSIADEPTYLRIDDEHDNQEAFQNEPRILREGDDCTIIAQGRLIHEALLAADELANEDLSCTVIANQTFPLDKQALVGSTRMTGCVVTVEEHGIGGLGSAMAEFLSEYSPCPLRMITVDSAYPARPTTTDIARAARSAIYHRCQSVCVDVPLFTSDVRALTPDHQFQLFGGTSLGSIQDLQHALLDMSDAAFSHHCNNHKNDFSAWIRDVFGERDLARHLSFKKTKLAMASCLAHWRS